MISVVVANPLHYIIGGFYFGTLGNATAYSILPISDGGLKYFFIHVRKCIDHIYEDLNADLSAEGLADFTNLNASYLSKLFKQETGQTIKAYVTAAKMDTAQNLLKYSNLSYFEISASLGYSSQSAFTYAFRKFTGVTPGKYRERNYAV